MTGYQSKRAAAQDKLDDDDTQVYQDHDDALTIAYQSGYYDGKKAAQPAQEPIKQVLDAEFNRGYKEGVRDAYAKSPQRPWVGLTEKEQDAVFKTFSKSEAYKLNFLNRVASAIEAKLKERNGG